MTEMSRKQMRMAERSHRSRFLRLRKVADALLTVAACVGAVVLVFAGATIIGWVTPLVVTSDSMQPEFSAGDFIIAHPIPASSLEPGDIATAPRPDGVLVTHRVVDVEKSGDTTTFTMQGDANDAVDSQPYIASEVLVPYAILPEVGWVISALNNSRFITVTAVSLIILVWALWKPRKSEDA